MNAGQRQSNSPSTTAKQTLITVILLYNIDINMLITSTVSGYLYSDNIYGFNGLSIVNK